MPRSTGFQTTKLSPVDSPHKGTQPPWRKRAGSAGPGRGLLGALPATRAIDRDTGRHELHHHLETAALWWTTAGTSTAAGNLREARARSTDGADPGAAQASIWSATAQPWWHSCQELIPALVGEVLRFDDRLLILSAWPPQA